MKQSHIIRLVTAVTLAVLFFSNLGSTNDYALAFQSLFIGYFFWWLGLHSDHEPDKEYVERLEKSAREALAAMEPVSTFGRPGSRDIEVRAIQKSMEAITNTLKDAKS